MPSADDVESSRKLVLKVPPHYPELARTIKLSGAVRMLVTVAPNGTVKNIKILGGSPVLAQAAEDAVEKWKWVAAPTETKVPVEINFRSD